jgi:hypothetical protein
MSFRTANIGLAVYLTLGFIGMAVVGFNPTDDELKVIFWPSMIVGFAVFLGLEHRDDRRARRERTTRSS